ncbi:bifunctional UDP-N-acetylmuramoyl-tripeptide:D-alanyl-D-alanine ligase/alanine racemase [Myroides sp. LJL119]
MRFKTSEFCQFIDADLSVKDDSNMMEFDAISVDSRSLSNGSKTMFFALEGKNHNGHEFIEDLAKQGVKYFVVSKAAILPVLKDVVYIRVKDTLQALQRAALFHREQFGYPIIAITGSKGKTIVKEWLNFLLAKDYCIIKSPKSYNSQTGVPLSIFGMEKKHNLGIFEVGISTENEMQNLQRIVLPTIGVLTTITNEHEQGFVSRDQKIKEKLELFKDAKVIITPYKPEIINHIPKEKAFTWSLDNREATVYVELLNSELQIVYNKQVFQVNIPLTTPWDIENIITCIATMLYLEIDFSDIQRKIPLLYEVELRLQLINGVNNCTIVEDVYNSDFSSLGISLDFLEKQKTTELKTIILSDVVQNGSSNIDIYKAVDKLLVENKINRLIAIGPQISKYLFSVPNTWLFSSTDSFLSSVSIEDFHDQTILIKGSRAFRFDKIVALLEKKTHETVLEVNLNAIRHNLNFYRSKLKISTKVMVMVKAFAYGNGSLEVAKLLSHENVDYLGVAFADEGIELRKAGIQTKIMVMNPEISAFNAMIAYDLEPEIYSLRELKAFLQIARSKNTYKYPIHIKLETGMHRHGFMYNELEELVQVLSSTNTLEVKSIFSHLSSSDLPEYEEFTLNQIKDFQANCSYLKQELKINPILHILNTSGIYNYSHYQMDMVRIGIGLYGIGNDTLEMKQLQNVSTLKTNIMQIKTVAKGSSIGYGRTYRTDKVQSIATIPIGYADGINRAWGNEKGYVLIKDKKAKIVGSICMDMLMVDVTDINCQEGDSAIIFGKDLPVTYIAKAINTIPYEILTNVAQRVKRIFYEE